MNKKRKLYVKLNTIHDYSIKVMIHEVNDSFNLKLDSGARINVIPKHILRKILLYKKFQLERTKIHVTKYEVKKLEVLGSCILKIGLGEQKESQQQI